MNRKVIIIAAVFGFLLIGLAVYGLFQSGAKKPTNQSTGQLVTDPVSGQTVIKDSKLAQGTSDTYAAERPVILGYNKLNDYGLNSDQLNIVYNDIYSFAINQNPKLKNFSIYKDSYHQTLPKGNDVVTHMTFMMQAEGKTDYYVDISYSGIDKATVQIYDSTKQKLLFTQ